MDLERDFEYRHFDSKYGKLHYALHRGTGPTIIFLHGFAGSIKSWTRLVRYLPQEFNMYLVDLLGHGESEAPDVDYSLSMHYETVIGLIESENLKKYYVFGHSYGGWIAAHCAMEESLRGIILEDSAGLTEFMEDRRAENPNYKEDMVRGALRINPREAVLRKMIDADNKDDYLTPDNLDTIESRTLIIWGGNDTTIKVGYSRIFNRAIHGSRLVVLESEKHTPHYSNPEAVSRLLIDFVKPG
jgi:pimeloyl-ACP methyl ester carboxylesterase